MNLKNGVKGGDSLFSLRSSNKQTKIKTKCDPGKLAFVESCELWSRVFTDSFLIERRTGDSQSLGFF